MKQLNKILENFFRNTGSGNYLLKNQIRERIEEICSYEQVGNNYTIQDDLTVDFDGACDISINDHKPIGFKIGKVGGSFEAIVSSKSADAFIVHELPDHVVGNFTLDIGYVNSHIFDNYLGITQDVGGDMMIIMNTKTCKGLPRVCNGDLYIKNKLLLRMEGCTKIVKGMFTLESADFLRDLTGCPDSVGSLCMNGIMPFLENGWKGITQKVRGTIQMRLPYDGECFNDLGKFRKFNTHIPLYYLSKDEYMKIKDIKLRDKLIEQAGKDYKKNYRIPWSGDGYEYWNAEQDILNQ